MRHSVPLEMLFPLVSFFAEVKISRFWPKTMAYNKAFLPKSRRFSAVLLFHSGRCYEAEICAILFLLRCPFIRYHILPKSKFPDFGQKPWTHHPLQKVKFQILTQAPKDTKNKDLWLRQHEYNWICKLGTSKKLDKRGLNSTFYDSTQR